MQITSGLCHTRIPCIIAFFNPLKLQCLVTLQIEGNEKVMVDVKVDVNKISNVFDFRQNLLCFVHIFLRTGILCACYQDGAFSTEDMINPLLILTLLMIITRIPIVKYQW